MKSVSVVAAVILALAMPLAANAESPTGAFSFNAAVTSDYVWRGFSQSNEDPALQGGVDFSHGDFYAGTWASSVDFGDGTDAEWDFYAGYTTTTGAIEWDFGVTYYTYVGDPSGSDYDFLEFKVAASHSVDQFTIGMAVHHSPDFYGADDAATYLEGSVGYTINDRWSVSAGVGRQFLDVGSDYNTWNIGAGFNLTEKVALDVRYWDADISSPLSDPRVAATLGVAF